MNSNRIVGIKSDKGKPRYSLIPWGPMSCVVEVMEYGARKYSEDNWRYVENGRVRFFDAAMRHMVSWHKGENRDGESDLPHLAHAVCCLLMAMYHDSTTL